MSMPRLLTLFTAPIVLLVALSFSHPSLAGKIYSSDGEAIRGYDVVAYFTEGKPVKGDDSISAEWNGTTWHFASAANRDAFVADPAKYAPQYGGYCAWAVSQGYAAPVDPAAWKIVDDKLYLNYSKGVQSRWSQNIQGNIANGDQNWPGIESGL